VSARARDRARTRDRPENHYSDQLGVAFPAPSPSKDQNVTLAQRVCNSARVIAASIVLCNYVGFTGFPCPATVHLVRLILFRSFKFGAKFGSKPAMTSCRKSLRSCARSRAGCRPSRAIHWMMVYPADKWGRLRPPHVWQASCDRWRRARGKQSRDVPIRIILEHANEYAASFWDCDCNCPTRRCNNQNTDG
jgi:hypothetical protein